MMLYKKMAFSLLSLMILLSSCGGGASDAPADTAERAGFAVPETDFLVNLFETVDYIDFVFDKTNFSISVSDPANAQRNVTYLSQNAVADINCTPSIGRMYFNSKGVSIATAQIHYSDACKYFIFVNDKSQKLSACLMSPQGTAFFENVFKQVQGQ